MERRLRRPDPRPDKAAATPIRTSKSKSRTCTIGHEASVSRIGEEQLFYLMSRGLTEAEASTMIVNGFIEPLVKELPMEYAVEMNRLIRAADGRLGGIRHCLFVGSFERTACVALFDVGTALQ